jgi:hypothetical protein
MRQGLAQHQQPEAVIDVGVRHDHRVERNLAGSCTWIQAFEVGKLLADVRTGVDDAPALAVRRYGDRGLGARGHVWIGLSRARRKLSPAIPLREPAACTRAQNLNLQEDALSRVQDTVRAGAAPQR